jgi:hypothetical protein
MDNTTPSVNPFDRLLNLLCFTPLGLIALLILVVLPLVHHTMTLIQSYTIHIQSNLRNPC